MAYKSKIELHYDPFYLSVYGEKFEVCVEPLIFEDRGRFQIRAYDRESKDPIHPNEQTRYTSNSIHALGIAQGWLDKIEEVDMATPNFNNCLLLDIYQHRLQDRLRAPNDEKREEAGDE